MLHVRSYWLGCLVNLGHGRNARIRSIDREESMDQLAQIKLR